MNPIKTVHLENILAESTLGIPQPVDTFRYLPIEFLHPHPSQPRQFFQAESLQELAASIKAQGIIQPIVVRQQAVDSFEIIAGERRWRAAQLAGLSQVPVVVKSLDDQAACAIALIENIQRDDLNPLEEANALKSLLQTFQMTHQQVAEALGKSRTAVTNSLRLLALAEPIKQLIVEGELSVGHARALLTLPLALQLTLAQKIVKQGLTVRATEKYAQQLQAETAVQQKSWLDVDTLRLQQQLTAALKATVEIKHRKNGSGQLVINYNDLQELNGILQYFPLQDSF
jgi:ParB family chromosome partitioning protein